MKTNLLNTNSKFKSSEIVGIVIAFIISLVLMKVLNYNKISLFDSTNSNNSLLGLNTFFGSVVFFSFSTFVVFGIKGSNATPNTPLIIISDVKWVSNL